MLRFFKVTCWIFVGPERLIKLGGAWTFLVGVNSSGIVGNLSSSKMSISSDNKASLALLLLLYRSLDFTD